MNTENIVLQIKDNQDEIINSLKQEYIVLYLFLMSELKKTDVTKNLVFQFVFRHNYGMNRVGLTENFYEEYFKTLEEYKGKPQFCTINIIIEKFLEINSRNSKKKNSIQFSFLTKLYHSIEPSKPIYDKYVCKACGISQYYISNEEKKIKNLLDAYEKIEKLYLYISKDNLLCEIIAKFDKEFKNPEISLTMKYDFIFWQAGKILEEKNKKTDNLAFAFSRGEARGKGSRNFKQ